VCVIQRTGVQQLRGPTRAVRLCMEFYVFYGGHSRQEPFQSRAFLKGQKSSVRDIRKHNQAAGSKVSLEVTCVGHSRRMAIPASNQQALHLVVCGRSGFKREKKSENTKPISDEKDRRCCVEQIRIDELGRSNERSAFLVVQNRAT
jgi:hypothetical protein